MTEGRTYRFNDETKSIEVEVLEPGGDTHWACLISPTEELESLTNHIIKLDEEIKVLRSSIPKSVQRRIDTQRGKGGPSGGGETPLDRQRLIDADNTRRLKELTAVNGRVYRVIDNELFQVEEGESPGTYTGYEDREAAADAESRKPQQGRN